MKKVLIVLVIAVLIIAAGVGIVAQSVKAATVSGTVDNVTGNKIIVEGITIFTDNNTRIKGQLTPGVFVNIQTTNQTDGSPLAVEIKARDDSGKYINIKGAAANLTGTSLVVDGKTINTNNITKINGSLAAGAVVEVKAITQSDGSLLAVKIKIDRVAHAKVQGDKAKGRGNKGGKAAKN
jgi:hypothetical protein